MKNIYLLLAGLFASLHSAGIFSTENNTEIRFISSPAQTTMVELYTSEGCSSCPPAEARLNRYTDDPALWKTVIPMAFHVDYWDYIGWDDRFATAAHGIRQSRYAELNLQRTVYTPAFIVNGKNRRPGWVFNKSPDSRDKTAGILAINIKNKSINVRFTPVKPVQTPLRLNVALLGMDLVSNISRGENTGRKAKHQFVVLAHQQLSSHNLHWDTGIPSTTIPAPRYALVAWISTPDSPAAVQAVGGYIPKTLVNVIPGD